MQTIHQRASGRMTAATSRCRCTRMLAHTARKGCRTVCQATAGTGTRLDLHVGETTISIPFSVQRLQELDASMNKLLSTFAEKQKAERPKRWEMMECRFKGDPAAGELELVEFFCNPNAYTNAFDAKLLITIRSGEGVNVTTEGRLSAVKSDMDALKLQAR